MFLILQQDFSVAGEDVHGLIDDHAVDLDRHRAAWGFFRDRRTDLYDVLG